LLFGQAQQPLAEDRGDALKRAGSRKGEARWAVHALVLHGGYHEVLAGPVLVFGNDRSDWSRGIGVGRQLLGNVAAQVVLGVLNGGQVAELCVGQLVIR